MFGYFFQSRLQQAASVFQVIKAEVVEVEEEDSFEIALKFEVATPSEALKLYNKVSAHFCGSYFIRFSLYECFIIARDSTPRVIKYLLKENKISPMVAENLQIDVMSYKLALKDVLTMIKDISILNSSEEIILALHTQEKRDAVWLRNLLIAIHPTREMRIYLSYECYREANNVIVKSSSENFIIFLVERGILNQSRADLIKINTEVLNPKNTIRACIKSALLEASSGYIRFCDTQRGITNHGGSTSRTDCQNLNLLAEQQISQQLSQLIQRLDSHTSFSKMGAHSLDMFIIQKLSQVPLLQIKIGAISLSESDKSAIKIPQPLFSIYHDSSIAENCFKREKIRRALLAIQQELIADCSVTEMDSLVF